LRAVRNSVHLQPVRPVLVFRRDSEAAAARRRRGLPVSGVPAGGGECFNGEIVILRREARTIRMMVRACDEFRYTA
jgi:hypothetical protein